MATRPATRGPRPQAARTSRASSPHGPSAAGSLCPRHAREVRHHPGRPRPRSARRGRRPPSAQSPLMQKWSSSSSSITAAMPAMSPAFCRSRMRRGRARAAELLEDERVVRRRAVERHLHAGHLPPAPAPRRRSPAAVKVGTITARSPTSRPPRAAPVGELGQHGLAEVGRRVERVDVHAVGHLAGHPQHPRVHRGDVDRRVGHVDRPGRPHARAAARGSSTRPRGRARSPRKAREDRPQRLDVLAQPRPRRVELGCRSGARCGPAPGCRARAGSARRCASASSHATGAVTIGLRGKATATPVRRSRSARQGGGRARRGRRCGRPR